MTQRARTAGNSEIAVILGPRSIPRIPIVALEEIELPYSCRYPELNQDNSHEIYDAGDINKLTSASVVVDDYIFYEDIHLLMYLSYRFFDKNPLNLTGDLPSDSKTIAYLFWLSNNLLPLVFPVNEDRCRFDPGSTASDLITTYLREADEILKSREWILGSHWSIFDAYLNWIARNVDAHIKVGDFVSLEAHSHRTEQRVSVRRAMAIENRLSER